MVKLKWIKNWKERKIGDVSNVAQKSAENFISQGYAEYVEEDHLNYKQKRAIKIAKKLPLAAAHMKKQGDEEKGEEILEEILEEEKTKEKVEKEELEKVEVKKYKKLQDKYIKRKTEPNDLFELRLKVMSELAKKQRSIATELMVEFIERKNYIYTIMEDERNEIWYYDNGVYVPYGKNFIQEECRIILKENFTNQLTNEVISKIEADTFISKELFFQNNYLDEVPLQNGVLNIKTKKLSSFNPKKIFFNKLPLEYNPKSKCPNIKKHFEKVLKDDEDSKVMFELFGFFLYKDYFIEKAIMFVGDGRNGKGKTIDLMKRFLGMDNCSSVPLNAMYESNFRTWDLFGKMANLAGDLSSSALKDTSILKQTTGRDLIGADRKRKSTVNLVNYSKHVFACYELPRVYDFTRGFWERWILFEFPYTFIKKELYDNLEKENKKEYRIRNTQIIDKLSTPEELSGLLNEALEGLNRLFKQKDFSYSKGVEEIKKFWIRKSDSFTSFAMDHLEEGYDEDINKSKIRKSFSKYCKEHKLRGASDKNIKVVLEEMFGVTERQDYETKLRVWEGIKFKSNSKYKYSEGKITG